MKNKRIKLVEEAMPTVNEVQLKDLYSSAAKVEQQVISLTDLAISFSNSQVKQTALNLKAKANEFSTLLSDIMTNASGGETDNFGDDRERLDAPKVDKQSIETNEKRQEESYSISESTIYNKMKKLFEAIEDEVAEDIDEVENGMEIDISGVFSELIDDLEEEELLQLKSDLIDIISTQISDKEVLKNFESVVDVDSMNFALSSLYDYADANGVIIKTIK